MPCSDPRCRRPECSDTDYVVLIVYLPGQHRLKPVVWHGLLDAQGALVLNDDPHLTHIMKAPPVQYKVYRAQEEDWTIVTTTSRVTPDPAEVLIFRPLGRSDHDCMHIGSLVCTLHEFMATYGDLHPEVRIPGIYTDLAREQNRDQELLLDLAAGSVKRRQRPINVA
ncbi:hypothetical protein HGRIS_007341 [Hohenbuehelia grisea]|uniref:Uncharacterized protein n=1 Tax=Hohenbuehelia grisea TaxID=104357 RepID=A0ABR3J4V1_9AGAR